MKNNHIDQLLDKFEQVNQQYAPVLTSFLDPRGQYILEVIVGSFEDMKVSYFGVNRQKEREQLLCLVILNLLKMILKRY